MKSITIFLLLTFLPVAVGACEWSFEYDDVAYSVFDDRVEVEKDGGLYVINENGVIVPEGSEDVICFALFGELMLGLIICPLLPFCLNPYHCAEGAALCILGLAGLALFSLCAAI